MNKNVVAVFAAVCGLVIVSCDTPKDQRPGSKVSVDFVEPGTRNTHNVGQVNEVHPTQHHQEEVILNHDPGASTIQPGDSVPATETTTPTQGAVKENSPARQAEH